MHFLSQYESFLGTPYSPVINNNNNLCSFMYLFYLYRQNLYFKSGMS